MPRQNRRDHEGARHHFYHRGNRKQAIFEDDLDRETFLKLILRFKGEFGISILAWCLMLNHFHLAAVSADGRLSEFADSLLGTYARLYNDRHGHVGHLFQNRFGNRLCTNAADVRGIVRYVHMNPVQAKLAKSPEEWVWSSHRGILTGDDTIVDMPAILELFGDLEAYQRFMAEPSCHEPRSLEEIAAALFGTDFRLVLGGSRRNPSTTAAKRELLLAGLREGHRASALARFLGQTPASITYLLKKERET